MSALGVYIVLGDLLVCGFLVGMTIWLLITGRDDKSFEEVARIPLEEPEAKQDQ